MEWNSTTRESLRNQWADLLVALVRSYRGQRTKMWSRIPDAMCAATRQTTRLDRWYSITLQSLQIDQQGSAARASSLCSIWGSHRAWIVSLDADTDEAERRALRLLREERCTITAFAQERWEQIKAMRTHDEPDDSGNEEITDAC